MKISITDINRFNATFDEKSVPAHSENKPLKLKHLYLEGTSLGKDDKKQWKLVTTKFPKLSRIYRFFKKLVGKTTFIAEDAFSEFAKRSSLRLPSKAAAPDSKISHFNEDCPIMTSKAFRSFLERDVVEIKEIKEKAKSNWARAAQKVISLTKGSKSLFTKGYIGKTKRIEEDYQQEIFHPQHLFGETLEDKLQEWKLSNSRSNFDHYLLDEGITSQTANSVVYLSEENRVLHEVLFLEDGKLMNQGKILDTTLPGSELDLPIFVISPDGKMYIGQPKVQKFHHSSFLSGGAVLSAGDLQTNEEGKLVKITNISGHYKPSREQLLNSLRFLKSKNVDLNNVKVVEVGSSATKIYMDAEKYLERKGNIKEDGFANKYISALYDYNEQRMLTSLRFDEHQFEGFDRAHLCKFVLDQLGDTDRLTLTQVLVHIGNGAYFKYPIREFIEKKGRLHSKEFEGGRYENGVLYLDKIFSCEEKTSNWRKAVVIKMLNSGFFDPSTNKIKVMTDKGYSSELQLDEI